MEWKNKNLYTIPVIDVSSGEYKTYIRKTAIQQSESV